jgi:hypothetical protein
MNRTWHLRIRKTHRYLGLFIGVQFLLWTVGGLYFSWSNLDAIHGDALKRPAGAMPFSLSLASPSVPMLALSQKLGQSANATDSILGVQLIEVLGQPVYQLHYQMAHSNGHAMMHTQLADARTGRLRNELTKAEATDLAQRRFAGGSAFRPSAIERVDYLTSTNGHHEYREKPLPAYAITFQQPAHETVYVAAQLGTVQSVRTDPWRIRSAVAVRPALDATHDGLRRPPDINNGLLRAFSVLGLLTISSGFARFGL